MTEWKLFDGTVADVSTASFHADRKRAPHLDQPGHRPRLERAAAFAFTAANLAGSDVTFSDLGCGDGGLLSLVQHRFTRAWGYDFTPANAAGWAERGVDAELLDVFGADQQGAELGDVAAVTEVLEHLTDPHAVVRWVGQHSRFIVASSPWNEGPWGYDECHAWAFDQQGYRSLIEQGGFRVLRHEDVGRFQVILGMKL